MRRFTHWVAFCLIAITSALATDASARDWRIDVTRSTLAIVYLINGEERRGEFSRFSGEAFFDPEDLSATELEFLIETGSIDAGDSFGTEVVRGVDWLDVENHPTARFVLTEMTPLSEGRYRVAGDLTLKGRTGVVSGEMSLSVGDDTAKAEGRSAFDRKDYKVGVGFTTLFVDVGDEIAVTFNLTATPVA